MRAFRRVPASIPRGILPAAATLALLAIPLVAMRFTPEVRWHAADFAVMGALLFGASAAFEWVLRSAAPAMYRLAMGLALLTALLMTWATLAVGLLAGESSALNAWLLVVVAAGLAGAFAVRLRPTGLSLVLSGMALVHAALTAMAVLEGWKPQHHGAIDIWAPNALFVLMFLAAAVLFWVAAEDGRRTARGLPPRIVVRSLQAGALTAVGAGIAAVGIQAGHVDDAPGAGVGGLLIFGLSLAFAARIALRSRQE